MAQQTAARPADLTPDLDAFVGLGLQASRIGLDVWEAAAQSFINHQVEIANLKRKLTTTYAAAARSALR